MNATAASDVPATGDDRRPGRLQPPGLLRTATLVASKDLAIELRGRSALFSVLVFDVLAVVIFYFAWDPTSVSAAALAPGVLWVTFVFSGLLALHRSFGVEHTDRAIDALLASPVGREGIYLGKAGANLVFVLVVQVVTVPLVLLFYNLPPLTGASAAVFAAILLLAAVGLVAVGTLFSAMAVNTRFAELLLPMLSLPFFVPVVTGAAQATARLLSGRPAPEVLGWLQLLAGFDLVFVVACALAFPLVVEE